MFFCAESDRLEWLEQTRLCHTRRHQPQGFIGGGLFIVTVHPRVLFTQTDMLIEIRVQSGDPRPDVTRREPPRGMEGRLVMHVMRI